jgi:protein-S-isoprenylcysteine O-methyltransferase Ste14
MTRALAARDIRLHLGEFFFRWRGYLPLALLPVTVIAVMTTRYPFASDVDLPWEIGCVLLALSGLALRVVTVGQAAPGTSGRNTRGQKASSLNTTGAYSVVRHPLYLGNSIIIIALALFPRTWIMPPLVALVTAVYYACIAEREEQYLRERFGVAFEAWAARVPAALPVFWRYVPSVQAFRWRTVLRREFYGLTVILVAPFFLDLLEDFGETGTLTLEPLWTVTVLVGVIIFLGFRFVKKRTRHVH